MPTFDVEMTMKFFMRVEAFDPREAMDIVIADAWGAPSDQITERHIEVEYENAVRHED